MNQITKFIMLFSIPILISISWLLGGTLVHKVTPLELSTIRFIVGSIFLFFFTDLKSFIKNKTKSEIINWFKVQFFLSLTGRALYAYFSAKSLLTISPFDAILLSTSLPVFLLILERFLGQPFKSHWTPILGILSFFAVFSSISTNNNSEHLESLNSLKIGHFEMLGAMLLYATHLIFYKKQVKDYSPWNTLFIQFIFASAMLLPFDKDHYSSLINFEFIDWLRFFIYAIICNLLPFVLVHYCLKIFSSFTVGAVAILSPLFAFFFSGIYDQTQLSVKSVLITLTACFLTFLTVRFDQRNIV